MSDTTVIDRVRLRALAEQATPGPWEVSEEWSDGAAFYIGPIGAHDKQFAVVADCDPWGSTRIGVASLAGEKSEAGYLQDKADAAFIAACDPPTLLLLLDAADERDRLAARVQELEQALRDYGHHGVICGSGLRSVWHEHLMEQCTCGLAAALKGSNP